MRSSEGIPDVLARLRRHVMVAASLLSGGMLLGLTAVTVVDVVGRYVFNSPVSGASEITEFLLIGTIFIGIPALTIEREHLMIDLVTEHLRGALRRWHGVIVQVLVMGFFAVAGWRLLEHAARLGAYQEKSVYLGAPYAPIARVAGVLLLLSALVVLGQLATGRLRKR